ncbi:hypothetical protein CEP54_016402, partial [Fusarium duplospermum]
MSKDINAFAHLQNEVSSVLDRAKQLRELCSARSSEVTFDVVLEPWKGCEEGGRVDTEKRELLIVGREALDSKVKAKPGLLLELLREAFKTEDLSQ